MTVFWCQLRALLWRNFLLKKRDKKQLIKEFVLPVYLVLLISFVKFVVHPNASPAVPKFPTYSVTDWRFVIFQDKVILVVPDTEEVKAVINDTKRFVGGALNPRFFLDEAAAEEAYLADPDIVGAGVVFHSLGDSPSYAIRQPYNKIASSHSMFTSHKSTGDCRDANNASNSNNCDANTYLTSGFLWLQRLIDAALINNRSQGFHLPEVCVQLMPKRGYTSDLSVIQGVSSIYFVLCFAFFISCLSINIVAEKEQKIREGMKIMGLLDSVFWLSWGITYIVVILIVTGVITGITYGLQFFSRDSNIFIFFLLMFLYGLSIIGLSFLLTPFFDSAQTAGVVTSFCTIAVSCLYFTLSTTRTLGPQGYQYGVAPSVLWVLCLLSPLALAIGIDQGIFLDTAEGGMTFDTLCFGEFPLYGPLVMLMVDSLIYTLFAVYLDHVLPSEYGPRYTPWYFLQPSYYRKRKSSPKYDFLVSYDRGEISLSRNAHDKEIEPVSLELRNKVGIRISRLNKEYKGENGAVHAVEDLSLDIYEGHITALLGHNGAGKTTLVNILCGLCPPTSGNASIYGMDVTNSGDLGRLRSMCGTCPQHNILFDDLTAKEHLLVFAGIKGIPAKQQVEAVENAMRDVDILPKADTRSKKLSGGQKRKLSVAMALIGDPKIIFLDEPTAGMDPFSRRHLWSLLQKNKPGRITVLTTHFMDEADILADRKAFISRGKLRCCGSSLFLKNKFGVGYHLNMVVDPHCESTRVTEVLQHHVEEISVTRRHAKELSYTIPPHCVSTFSSLFSSLEETIENKTRAERLGIKSYGVSMTTLEEVFLKLEDEKVVDSNKETKHSVDIHKGHGNSLCQSEEEVSVDMTPQSINSTDGSTENMPDPTCSSANTPRASNLSSQRCWTLLKIRFLLHRRHPLFVFFQVFLPVAFVSIGCALNKTANPSSDAADPKPLQIFQALSAYTSYLNTSTGKPVAVIDLQGDENSRDFMTNLTYPVDEYNQSVGLLSVPTHYLGFRLEKWQPQMDHNINYTALYNDSAIHSLPAIVNLMSNAIYKMATGSMDHSINVSSLPWPAVTFSDGFNYASVFSSTLFLALAFVVMAPGFAMHLIRDRLMKARGQLRVAGVTFNQYWGSIFTFHLGVYILPVVLSLIVVSAFQISSLTTGGAMFSLALLYLTFLPANMMLAYVFSFGFDKLETCQAVLPNVLIFCTLAPYVAVSLTDVVSWHQIAKIVHYVFTVIDPPYSIAGGLYHIDRIYRTAPVSKTHSIPMSKYFDPDSDILVSILMPLVHLVWLYILLRVLDVRSTGGRAREAVACWTSNIIDVSEDNHDVIDDEDEDVAAERRKVTSLGNTPEVSSNTVAFVENLRKEFKESRSSGSRCRKGQKKDTVNVAVRNVTFAVDSGGVFGLLGPNGAGKTTTLNMMIAETGPTKGKVVVAGNNIRSSLSDAFQAMGYCPQHDALWELLTLREHLEFYGMMRGLTKKDAVTVTDGFVDRLKLQEHAKKYAKNLSGGTKRKLSYAISMLANPRIVLLDEPSTGMDPQSKRFLWDTISNNFRGSERGAILTTHYMEEADALCSRLAIMVNGKIKCLGPSQHLKDKYGSGYLLEVKLKRTASSDDMEERMNALERHLASLFPESKCLERFEERGQYKIPRSNVKSLAQTFSSLEEIKVSHSIEEYSFSQSTLEQVFLEFAKKQHKQGGDTGDMEEISREEQDRGNGTVTVHL